MARLIIGAVILVAVFTAVQRRQAQIDVRPLTNQQKCVKLYKGLPGYNNLDNDPKYVVLMIERGVRNADELTEQLCTYLDSRGQVF